MVSPSLHVRPAQAVDLPALGIVLDQTALFPSEMLSDMIAGFLEGRGADMWLTCLCDDQPVGLCYALPEMLAEGTWNMLALAVLPELQGKGCGKALTEALEARLQAQGQRILIVDTSSTEDFARARAFYAGAGYGQEARIRDFWAPGDDKIIFRKALG